MTVFAKFDETPLMTLQDIKETKRNGHTFVRSDNVKTVYPPTNTVCGGYNEEYMSHDARNLFFGVSDQVLHKPGCTAKEDG